MKKKLKKKLNDFMKDESGAMSKENILKVGIGTLSALGMLSSATSNTWAGHTNTSAHINSATLAPDGLAVISKENGYYKLVGPDLTGPKHINALAHSNHNSY